MDKELEHIIYTVLSLEEDYPTLSPPLRNLNQTYSSSGELPNILANMDKPGALKARGVLEKTILELCSYLGFQEQEENRNIRDTTLIEQSTAFMNSRDNLFINQSLQRVKGDSSKNPKDVTQNLTEDNNNQETISSIRSRKKTFYNKEQTAFLQSQFDLNPYPDFVTRCRFAQTMGVPESRIQIWFQNRRARHLCRPRNSPEQISSPTEDFQHLEKSYEAMDNPKDTSWF
ncbi:homeobox protein siamois-like [Gastrophryne carolinensis]